MAKFSGFGIRLKRGDGGAPEAFNTVSAITELSGPDASHPTLECTDNDDVTAAAAQFCRRGWRDNGKVGIDGNLVYSDASQVAMDTSLNDSVARNFQIINRGGNNVITFAGWVEEFKRKHPIGAVMTYSMQIQVNGAITLV